MVSNNTKQKKDTLELRAEMAKACISHFFKDEFRLIMISNWDEDEEYLFSCKSSEDGKFMIQPPYNIDEIAEKVKDYKIGGSEIGSIKFIDGKYGRELELGRGWGSKEQFTMCDREVFFEFPYFWPESQLIQIGWSEGLSAQERGNKYPLLYDMNGNRAASRQNAGRKKQNGFNAVSSINKIKEIDVEKNPNLKIFKQFVLEKREDIDKRIEENKKAEEENKAKIIQEYKNSLWYNRFLNSATKFVLRGWGYGE